LLKQKPVPVVPGGFHENSGWVVTRL